MTGKNKKDFEINCYSFNSRLWDMSVKVPLNFCKFAKNQKFGKGEYEKIAINIIEHQSYEGLRGFDRRYGRICTWDEGLLKQIKIPYCRYDDKRNDVELNLENELSDPKYILNRPVPFNKIQPIQTLLNYYLNNIFLKLIKQKKKENTKEAKH